MLLKVYVEDTLPFVQNGKGNTLVNWIVNETLPLNHPQQLSAFASALGLQSNEFNQIDPQKISLLYGSETVDTTLTPSAAMLVGGTVLTMAAKSNTPRTVRQTSVMKSPRINDSPRNNKSPEDGSADDDSRYADTASPSEFPDGDEASSAIFERDELYVSEECGWFPFHLNSNYGQLPVATYIDPLQAPKETDRNPPQQQLCPTCSSLLSECTSLQVPVDRHYKPMSLNYEVSEGWVEKLSLGRLSRWQKRYLTLSDRSVDWFQDQPTPGDKAKIKGTRHVMRDGVINIADIIENPDPALYPKCKDTNYFHFGLVFKQPNTTLFFRVPSVQQRTKHVTFLKQMVTRLSNTGAQKDPVYWKKWADALLTNLADLGEVAMENRNDRLNLERELAEIQIRRNEIKSELPGLKQVLEKQRESVQTLKRELSNIDSSIENLGLFENEAKERLVKERSELGFVEIEIGDELRKAELLRSYAKDQEEQANNKIKELEMSINELKEKHARIFNKWRKLEEQTSTHRREAQKQSRGGSLSFSAFGIPLSRSVKSLPENLRKSLSPPTKSF